MPVHQQPPHIHKAKILPSNGNEPTPLKTPGFKGFYSSRFAIDSNMTANNQDALLFTAEHLLVLGTDLIIQVVKRNPQKLLSICGMVILGAQRHTLIVFCKKLH